MGQAMSQAGYSQSMGNQMAQTGYQQGPQPIDRPIGQIGNQGQPMVQTGHQHGQQTMGQAMPQSRYQQPAVTQSATNSAAPVGASRNTVGQIAPPMASDTKELEIGLDAGDAVITQCGDGFPEQVSAKLDARSIGSGFQPSGGLSQSEAEGNLGLGPLDDWLALLDM